MVGDYYLSKFVFKIDEFDAVQEAINLGRTILNLIDNQSEMDDGTKAMQLFKSWVASHNASFLNNPPGGVRYGFIDAEVTYVYPNILEQMFRDNGFNVKRVMKDWADRKWIITHERGGQRRLQTRKKYPVSNRRLDFYAILNKVQDDAEEWPA